MILGVCRRGAWELRIWLSLEFVDTKAVLIDIVLRVGGRVCRFREWRLR